MIGADPIPRRYSKFDSGRLILVAAAPVALNKKMSAREAEFESGNAHFAGGTPQTAFPAKMAPQRHRAFGIASVRSAVKEAHPSSV
jgi:hypothetical protein